ncbi:MAG: hypothetical protein RMK20_04015 [Verrucomicrobiales bacterium]|nr:hypothetical protein [Verrucomicrobiales bacterium]
MKRKLTQQLILMLGLIVSGSSAARAEILLLLNIKATALVQAGTTWAGDNYTTPNPTRLKIDNRTILERLATVTGLTFPPGSQPALSSETGRVFVVGRTNNIIADVSEYIGFEFDEDGPSVYADKGNVATGADTTKSWFLGTLWYDDETVTLYMTGLVTTTETTSARRSDGSQQVSINGALNNAVGGGFVGDDAVVSGSVTARGRGIVFD